ncbi:MAG TPA: peptidylprolyl isomerase, partial [Enhygromyxa sp.]|nr:peptidylprolyl isomerase [Enhygromyxa sp.]
DGDYGHGNLHPDCLGDAPIVVFETTLGTMVLQLDAVRAPITVENFLGYVSSSWYDNTIFHRVIDGFVIQGGGYQPGLVLKQTVGTIPLEIDPALTHVDGAIAMARRQEPDTAESQWYITDGPTPQLDGSYAVFGVIIDGFEVRNAISAVATETVEWMGFPLDDVPVDDVVVTAAYCVTSWP